MNRWMMVFAVVLVLGGGWLWWSRPDGELAAAAVRPQTEQGEGAAAELLVGPGVGRMAPDFVLPTLDGGEFRLSEQRGKPVVLNFWATWCGPCQRELPALQKAAEHFGDDVVFVGVDQGEEAAIVQTYVDKLGLTFTIPMDAEGQVGFDWNVQGLPTTFFIDRSGVIRSLWMGEMNSVTLAENISIIQ